MNAWLGGKIIPQDVNVQNRNGILFEHFLNENKLTCVNSLPLTQGLITRRRKYLSDIKESIIDFYVVCESVLPYVTSMKIDNCKTHRLTNYGKIDSMGSAVNSNHFPLTMEVKLETPASKHPKVEIFNFKDKNSQIVFKGITSETEEFTNVLDNRCNLSDNANNWLKVVKSHCKRAFKKIRIRTRSIKPWTHGLKESRCKNCRDDIRRRKAKSTHVQKIHGPRYLLMHVRNVGVEKILVSKESTDTSII